MSPPQVIGDTPRTSWDPQITSQGANQTPTTVSAKKEEPPPKTPDAELLEQARERFRRSIDADQEWRENATKELDFADNLEHWDEAMKQERKGRPCLTFDLISPAIEQVVNNARQSPPEPRISPVGGGADEATAKILQGLLRNCENDSKADVAYLTAYEYAVKIGRGWWRLDFEFEENTLEQDAETGSLDPALFQQKIVIKRIPNPFSVYPDPAADEFDYSDMRYCFVTETLDKDTFQDLYPDALITMGFAEMSGKGDELRDEWYPEDGVRVAEYWWVEIETKTIVQMRDGTIKAKSKVLPYETALVVNERKVTSRKVYGAKITGSEVLETWTWPGKWIPIIPVIGKESIRRGKRRLKGMVRAAMDINLSYDYMCSKEAEAIGLAPISQWLAAKGQLENQEQKWGDANRKAFPFLEYNSVDGQDSHPLPPPQRVQAEPAVQGISGAIMRLEHQAQTSLSMFRPDMGEPTPEQSGVAIRAIQRQGDNAHFNYHDNFARSLMHTGRQFVDLVPHIYSEQRIITIYDPDGQVSTIELNKETTYEGVKRIFKFGGTLRFDVTVGKGPGYASRKDYQTDSVSQIVQANPQAGARVLDLYAKMLDLPDEFAERWRPSDIQQTQDQEHPPTLRQMQMIAGRQDQIIKALTQQLQVLETEKQSQMLKLESSERNNIRDNAAAVAIADMKHNQDAFIETMKQQFAQMTSHADRVTDIYQQQAEQQAEAEQNQQQQQHEAAQAQQAQQAQPQPQAQPPA